MSPIVVTELCLAFSLFPTQASHSSLIYLHLECFFSLSIFSLSFKPNVFASKKTIKSSKQWNSHNLSRLKLYLQHCFEFQVPMVDMCYQTPAQTSVI